MYDRRIKGNNPEAFAREKKKTASVPSILGKLGERKCVRQKCSKKSSKNFFKNIFQYMFFSQFVQKDV
jgi:hypothetical protein